MKNYFLLRDLKNWLEKIPESDRANCLCLIGGDDTSYCLNFSTYEINEACPIQEFTLSYDCNFKGLVCPDLLEELLHPDATLSNLYEEFGVILKDKLPDIKEIIVLDKFDYKMTAEDLLKKINKLNPSCLDLMLFHEGFSLNYITDWGIGYWDLESDGEGTLNTIECEDDIMPQNCKKALVLEIYEGGDLSDCSIYQRY